jgi:RHS repeat-associated protein
VNGTSSDYTYDAFGNLQKVVQKSSTGTVTNKTIEYLSDALGRRVAKKVNGQVVRQYAYRNKLQIVGEIDPVHQVVRRFWYGSRANVPDFMEEKTSTGSTYYRIISDQLGSPVLVVNATTGAIVSSRNYDEWGGMYGTGLDQVPFGFAGGLYDADTLLVRFGARDYDPETGRWTSKDPILFNGGQANLYVYVGNDPVNRADPSGLKDWSDCETRELLRGYAGHLKSSRFPYLLMADLHKGAGDLDFWSVAQDDTFQISGVGKLNSAQFGNFIAGFGAGVLDDALAYWLVRGAGSLYGTGASLNGTAGWGELQYLGDNGDSVSNIDLGPVLACEPMGTCSSLEAFASA